MKKITIAIDGFSSTGKSTMAKSLAKKLGYIYVDSGAMYRAITLFALQNKMFDTKGNVNSNQLIKQLEFVDVSFSRDEQGQIVTLLNNNDVEEEIRSLAVSNKVSQIASISEVRKKMVSLQQAMGENKGVVMDGRDIGTVVFPDAELKLFIESAPEVRAKRRFLEFQEKGQEVSYEATYKNIVERDHLDTTRADSPLVQAEDAIAIDNSEMTIDEQLSHITKLAEQIINN